jgi:hypothetical protein
MDITEPILPRTLTDRASGRSLVVEQTGRGDIYVEFWVAGPGDGRSVLLSTAQIRELYDALSDRLLLLEGHR